MSNEKDRFGDKLKDVEAAREDQWAHKRDEELLKKMREKLGASLDCPHCQRPLEARLANQIEMYACPGGHGAWLEPPALAQVTRGKK